MQVGGAFLTLEGGFEPSVDGVGVDDLGQMSPGAGQVGGVEVSGLPDQDLLPTAPDQLTGRQVLN